MTRKTRLTILAGLLVGGALVLMLTGSGPDSAEQALTDGPGGSAPVADEGGSAAEGSRAAGRRERPVRGRAALEREFPAERIEMAGRASAQVLHPLKASLDRYEREQLARNNFPLLLLDGQVSFSAAELGRIQELYLELAAREITSKRAVVERLCADPAPLMRLMLMRVEYGREFTNADWKQFYRRGAAEFKDVKPAFDWVYYYHPYEDPEIRRTVAEMLDPERREKFLRIVEAAAAERVQLLALAKAQPDAKASRSEPYFYPLLNSMPATMEDLSRFRVRRSR